MEPTPPPEPTSRPGSGPRPEPITWSPPPPSSPSPASERSAPPADDGPDTPPDRSRLSRRRFLTVTGGAAAVVAGGALAWQALLRDHVDDALSSGSPGSTGRPGSAATGATGATATGGRVLVVVQLSGGNDSLNTLVPVHDGRYFDARPTLRVAEKDAVALAGAAYGLHPSLRDWASMWDAGRMAAVEAVGFTQGQSRSHFQAMDLWWSALPGQARTTGWLGRWLDRSGDVTNPLRAIALGGGSPALVGDQALSTMVLDPAAFALLTPRGADAAQVSAAFAATAEPLASDPDLAAAQRAVPAALHAVDLLGKVTGSAGTPGSTGGGRRPVQASKALGGKGEGEGDLAELLKVAAGVIDLQIGTQVIVVGASGFDTHADEADRHPKLLADLATGVSEFWKAMETQGRADDVLMMTTSEFGRRVTENGSGTDHGKAGAHFLFGPSVHGRQVVGEADLASLDEGDLRSTLDTRSVYAAALDWLGGDAGLTDDVLSGTFDRHGLVTA